MSDRIKAGDMSSDEAKTKIELALRNILGKFTVYFIVPILIGICGYAFHTINSMGELNQKVNDLSNKIDDKYSEIRGEVESHYAQVDRRSDEINTSLTVVTAALASQSIELAEIKQQLFDAKTQEHIDIERTNAEKQRVVIQQVPAPLSAPPSPPPLVSLPIIGPLLTHITKKGFHHSGQTNHR